MPCAKLENESGYYFFFRKLPIARSILNYLYAFKEPGNLMMRSGETHKTLPAVMFKPRNPGLKIPHVAFKFNSNVYFIIEYTSYYFPLQKVSLKINFKNLSRY